MTAIKINTELLLASPFRKSGLSVFLVHWMAWMALHFIVYLPQLVNSNIGANWESFIFNHFVVVTINFLLFYIVAFYIMPRMASLPKKWFWVVAASLLLTIFVTYLQFRLYISFTEYLLNKTPFRTKFPQRTSADSLGFFSYRFRGYFTTNILTYVSVAIAGFAYRLLLLWFQQEKIRKELENQKLQAELSFLKMQVNPHFLFNALNNIYSLAVMEKSKRTSESIMKLSELMRYVLYEKEDADNKVSLEKEIRHINSYIDLEKLRHHNGANINFAIEGDIQRKRIAPLLLFPLIENSCKHGMLTDPQKPVDIHLKVSDHTMDFSIENFISSYQKDKIGGIGIPNVKKRLDLIYGKNYSLNVKTTDEKFIVNLQLPL